MWKNLTERRKFILTTLLAAYGAVGASIGLVQSCHSSRIAERANEIAERSNRPDVVVEWDPIPVRSRFAGKPALLILSELRLANRGGRSVTVTSIGKPQGQLAAVIWDGKTREQWKTGLGFGVFLLKRPFFEYANNPETALDEWPNSNRVPLPLSLELPPGADRRINVAFQTDLQNIAEEPVTRLKLRIRISLSDGTAIEPEMVFAGLEG